MIEFYSISKEETMLEEKDGYTTCSRSWYIHPDISSFLGKKKVIFHRENGPAFVGSSGVEYYFIHGKLHRLDGLAIIVRDTKCNEFPTYKEIWVVNDSDISYFVKTHVLDIRVPRDWTKWTEYDKSVFYLSIMDQTSD